MDLLVESKSLHQISQSSKYKPWVLKLKGVPPLGTLKVCNGGCEYGRTHWWKARQCEI